MYKCIKIKYLQRKNAVSFCRRLSECFSFFLYVIFFFYEQCTYVCKNRFLLIHHLYLQRFNDPQKKKLHKKKKKKKHSDSLLQKLTAFFLYRYFIFMHLYIAYVSYINTNLFVNYLVNQMNFMFEQIQNQYVGSGERQGEK